MSSGHRAPAGRLADMTQSCNGTPLTRRRALAVLGAAGIAPAALASGAGAAATGAGTGAALPPEPMLDPLPRMDSPKPVFVVLNDLGADLTADAFRAVAQPFADLGIPVGVVLGNADTLPEVTAALLALVADSPDLAEIIAAAPGLASLRPYFQLRAAAEARARVAALLDPSHPRRTPPILSLAAEAADNAPALDGLRAVGFRNVLLLPGTDPVPPHCGALPCLHQGVRRRIIDPLGPTLQMLATAIVAQDKIVLCLSLERSVALATEELQTRSVALARTIEGESMARRVFAALPRDHVRWFASGTERLVALRIEEPPAGDGSSQAALAAFTDDLRAAGLAFTLTPASSGSDCVRLAGTSPACIATRNLSQDRRAELAAHGVEVILHPQDGPVAGLDENGLLHLAETLTLGAEPSLGRGLDGLHPLQDALLGVTPAAYADAVLRGRLVADLQGIVAQTQSRCLPVPAYAEALRPADPVYRVMLATRRAALPAPQEMSAAEREEFLEDARIAWSYVGGLTDRRTGLCPSTAAFDRDEQTLYPYLTMWDLGSLFQATLAAHELGLIQTAEFDTRIKALLAALPSEKVAGLTLPPEEIRTDRKAVSAPGFNLCDAGRLLSALAEVDRYPAAQGLAAGPVGRWALAGVIRERQLLTVTGSALAPVPVSHCSSYAARAFGRWGLAAASPHDLMRGETPTDARMALLYEVARIGAIGAEPLLLETVEMGASAASDYLTEVLYAAQVRFFARDGRLIAVSETPMDRAPWFTAQGFLVDGGTDGDWDVQSPDPMPAYDSPAFKADARVISTKAAFLWAAVRPGPYSARLLDLVRRQARASRLGYAAGIYAASGVVMRDYTDINTNGVILQAIAYALRGHRPRTTA